MGIHFKSIFGKPYDQPPRPSYSTADPKFTFNTPVGVCTDHYGRVWLADTGNNRLIVLNASLDRVLGVFGCAGTGAGEFNMPFRVLSHPDQPWLYVSDIGNKRIQRLEYDRELNIGVTAIFGDQGPPEQRLAGPNGLTWCDGRLVVADEFYVGPDGRSRLAIFSDEGVYLHEIQQIQGARFPHLLWPQGISADSDRRLYIANTGMNCVVRCDLQGQAIPFPATGMAELADLDLSRDVAVIEDEIFIPGGEENAILRFNLDGERTGSISGLLAPIQVAPWVKEGHILVTRADSGNPAGVGAGGSTLVTGSRHGNYSSDWQCARQSRTAPLRHFRGCCPTL